ncbi:hypothetical protein BZL39_C08840 [Zygosaccharomyces parabailii]|nr:hypothetical protein BZL39_C08840 [Zygosaccharomyces parabailii]CDH15771.1 uncharacterized protein ZBAI_07558 [Zygosaccharomyces bailii ISA1307]
MPNLTKLYLSNSHGVNGNEFPIAFSLDASDSFKESPERVSAYFKNLAQTDFFNKALAFHGTIIIRNTGTTDPEVISKYINAIGTGSGDQPFVQNGTTATRTEITDILCTANEGPSSIYIHQHNEFSRFKKHPTKLFFVCTKYGSETKGGQTPIVHGAELFKFLSEKTPDLLNNLAIRGLYYAQIWANVSLTKTSWKDYYCFGREINKNDELPVAKQKAQKNVHANVSEDYEWLENNDLLVHQHTKPVRLYHNQYTGQRVPTLFTSLATYFYQYKVKSYNTPTFELRYDDGKVIDKNLLEILLQASIDLSYEHEWQEGDIAIVDNYQVSHGRCPWSDGPRQILVSLWDTPNKQDYRFWIPPK